MRRIYSLTFPLLYLATVSNGQSVDRVSPLPPSVDAFYQPPPSFETASPGTILRSRRVPPTTRVNTTALADTYQLLLRSRDSQGAPTAIVTTVFIPPNAASDKLLEIQFAYDSASVDCSPSYTLFQNDTSLPEAITVSAGLQQGWNVAVTDYEGFTASFSNGLRAGYSMLDATRACLSSKNITGIDENAKVVLAGTSGGALASEWALELQASYAPELKFAGALLTALTPNASSVFGTVDGTADAGLIASGVLGLAKEYLNISDWLSENLVQGDAVRLSQAAHSCIVDTISAFNNTDFVPFFDVPSFLTATVPNSVIQNTGIMGLHGVPAAPIYNYKGTADEVSVVEDTDALVEKFCGEGADIEYYRALNASHGSAGAHGFLAGWSWINDRMNGVPVLGGCQTYNVTIPT